MNKDLKTEFQLSNDGDQWGNCMQWLFAVCDYLTFQTDKCVPDDWQFRPSHLGADIFSDNYKKLLELNVPSEDVLHFGNLLVRFSELLKRKGLDY